MASLQFQNIRESNDGKDESGILLSSISEKNVEIIGQNVQFFSANIEKNEGYDLLHTGPDLWSLTKMSEVYSEPNQSSKTARAFHKNS